MHKLRSILSLALLALITLTPLDIRAADYSVTAASVLASAQGVKNKQYNAGASITAGQPVYLDANSTWQLADANGASPLYKVEAIALHAASTGQPLIVCESDPSFTPGFTVAAGAIVVLSATAGGLCPAADLASGHYPAIIGIGIGSNKIKLGIVRTDVAVP